MIRTPDSIAILRTLDAADLHLDPHSARARTDLDRILASEPSPQRRTFDATSKFTAGAARPRRDRRTARRIAAAGVVLVAATSALVALPSLVGGDTAFASWVPTPVALTAEQRTAAADSCRDAQVDGAGTDFGDELRSADTAVAERRGTWTTVVLSRQDGFSALCITDSSAHLFARDMIGSVGHPDVPAPGPRDLVATDLGVGTMNAADVSLAAGAAGVDVTQVTYRSPTRGDVSATVSGGRFALWLPGGDLKDANSVEVQVGYRDGTTAAAVLTL